MKAPSFPVPSIARHAILLAVLACACALAAAGDGLARARRHGALTIGVDYMVPAYTAGAKFRTPDGIGQALAEDLAHRMQLPLTTRRADPDRRSVPLKTGATDLLLVALAENDPLYRSAAVIPTGYSAGPMAIMRTDTTIKSWAQLKGRIVCIAEGSRYAGTIAETYGAIEQRYRAPADSLLAMRIGECDAAVDDSTMLEELLKLPEWKKFSARLPIGPRSALVLVVPRDDAPTAAFLKQAVNEWHISKYLNQVITKSIRNIAFEVYLDQNVPDCH